MKEIGRIGLPDRKFLLKYYIVHSKKGGYGIAISQHGATRDFAQVVKISHDRIVVERLIKRLMKGIVVPRHLPNILQDMGI